ncbi:MAG: hypothetical protein ABII71_06305 [Candidatus Micrarchaeota archaeon]
MTNRTLKHGTAGEAGRPGTVRDTARAMAERAKARLFRTSNRVLVGMTLAVSAPALVVGGAVGLTALSAPKEAQAGNRGGVEAQDVRLPVSLATLDASTDAAHYNHDRRGGAWVTREHIPGVGRIPADATYSNAVRIPSQAEDPVNGIQGGPVTVTVFLGMTRTDGGPVNMLSFRTPTREGELSLDDLATAMAQLGGSLDRVAFTVHQQNSSRFNIFVQPVNAAGDIIGQRDGFQLAVAVSVCPVCATEVGAARVWVGDSTGAARRISDPIQVASR